ncbi:GXWXG domain-containing protein [Kineococcus arenarius]|uniref:GXWXG domain-containing protein n=1 Tax=Kineococcus sp. SYSU DK007 TaxID=3383128 RepID=UPI003D7CCD0A
MGTSEAEQHLLTWPERGDAQEALDLFDALAPLSPAELRGRWRGTGLPTGHRLDGLLELHGWYGKEFLGPEEVHPLLFRDARGRPRPVDPRWAPVGLLREHGHLARNRLARCASAVARPLLFTRRPAARLRLVEHRGAPTATVVYDDLPVLDHLRRAGPTTLLGVMDLRGLREPFFFVLHRAPERP